MPMTIAPNRIDARRCHMRFRALLFVLLPGLTLPVAVSTTASATTRTPCPLIEEASIPYIVDPVDLQTYYSDLWRPDDGGLNHPGIVVIHGGGFTAGDRSGVTSGAQTP